MRLRYAGNRLQRSFLFLENLRACEYRSIRDDVAWIFETEVYLSRYLSSKVIFANSASKRNWNAKRKPHYSCMTTRQRSRNTGLTACRINPIPSVKYCQLFCLELLQRGAVDAFPLLSSSLPSPIPIRRETTSPVRSSSWLFESEKRRFRSWLLSNSRSKEISSGLVSSQRYSLFLLYCM